MKPENLIESQRRYAETVSRVVPLGWTPVRIEGNPNRWLFAKGGKVYDLSAADLEQLEQIEREGLFAVGTEGEAMDQDIYDHEQCLIAERRVDELEADSARLQAEVERLKAEQIEARDTIIDREYAMAWLVDLIIADPELQATPDKAGWYERARKAGTEWRQMLASLEAEIRRLKDESALAAENERLTKEHAEWQMVYNPRLYDAERMIADVTAQLPETFYAGNTLARRLALMVGQWQKAAKVNQELEARVANLESSLAATRQELEQAKAERDAYRAVLEGAEFERVSELPSRGVQFCRVVGVTAAQRMQEMKAERDKSLRTSEGRLKVLNEKAEEARREWLRAENAEGQITRLRSALATVLPLLDHAILAFDEDCNDGLSDDARAAKKVITSLIGAGVGWIQETENE